MHADYRRSDARDKCEAEGARLPLHADICTSEQRLHTTLSADGSALGGDKWIPVRTPDCEDDTEACDIKGTGWVQIGDAGRLCKTHQEAHGGDTTHMNWGHSGAHDWKSTTTWCARGGESALSSSNLLPQPILFGI